MLMYLTIIDSKEGQQKFEFIYNRYKKLMFYIANKILGDTRDSEDTVHDAFLKIIEIIDDIKDVEPFILMVTGDMNSDELIQVAKGITVTTK